MVRLLLILCMCFTLIGCRGWRSEKPPIHLNPNLDFQASIKPQEAPEYNVENTVPWGTQENFHDKNRQKVINARVIDKSKDSDGNWVQQIPVDVNYSLLLRGQERYNIYCSACHGKDGSGNGIIMDYWGFKPRSYWDPVVVSHQDGKLFDIISNGIRSMKGYSQQISSEDRWAIVAYLRALQVSNLATKQDVSTELFNQIK